MKTIYTLLLTCIFSVALAHNTTYEKLVEVNKCWKDQKDIDQEHLPAFSSISGKEWIRLHLSLVEQKLRERSNEALTITQRQNRINCLNNLHGYWQAGNFPVNEDYSYRTPVFIDRHNNFCAVGYLIKASGNEQVARMIAANTNLAYVHDMKYPQLKAWADENGFTVDELAWIQPTYPPKVYSANMGKGVDGEVKELFVDSSNNRLFVGGAFVNADSTIECNNIAWVTGSLKTYTWHNLGTGVNGTVNAIIKYDNKIFAAGSFNMAGGLPADNIAYWDDTAWHSAGCINGTINNMVIFDGDLYAAGDFDVCGGSSDVNFAKWDGTAWLEIPGLNGHINTMQVMDTVLLLGGAFSHATDTPNAIKWNNTSGFMSFANHINNEVKDFEVYDDTIYAAGIYTDTVHTPCLLLKLYADTWNTVFDSTYMLGFSAYTSNFSGVSFNTLCVENGSLNIGGKFGYTPASIGTVASNCFNISTPYFSGTENWFAVDDEVNKMVLFNGDLIVGGKFKKGYNGWFDEISVNGIAKKNKFALALPTIVKASSFKAYPNPVSSATLTIENSFNADHFTIHDINAKLIASGILSNKPTQQITMPSVSAGAYLLEISNDKGERLVKEITVM